MNGKKKLLPSIKDFTEEELQAQLGQAGEKAYRSQQIFSWLYQHGVSDFSLMKNLPLTLREKLASSYRLSPPSVISTQKSRDGAEKYLFRLEDGCLVEAVLIPARHRQTVCVSTQVGCRYRCAFCASGQMGFIRNLSPGEMVDQVLYPNFVRGVRVSHIVFMGMGEPFDNFDALVKAIQIINHPSGLNIGSRKITVSTAGHIPGIEKFSQSGWQVELAISLHSVEEETRSKLMPINRIYPVKELLAVCRRYTRETGRLITFEYVLLRGINDAPEQARALGKAARWVGAKINLIPCSRFPDSPWQPPERKTIQEFVKEVESQGVVCTLRRSRGKDIQAACGQLAGRNV